MRQRFPKLALGISIWTNLLLPANLPAETGGTEGCRVVQQEGRAELHSPFFVFRLDTTAGLRAQSWENRLAAQTLQLGDGPELEIDIGLPDHSLQTPQLKVSAVQVTNQGEVGEVVFTLTADEPAISASVTYRWDVNQPVLRKFVEITNRSGRELDRLLNVRLGTYRTDARIVQREQGFPVYLNDACFLSLAHPAGWATGGDGNVSLRQYPGMKLAAGATFKCMEAVYGVAKAGEARPTFVAHVRSHMRRVVRGHDKPYAIFSNYGSWPSPPGSQVQNSETYMFHSLSRLAESQRITGCRFDLCDIEFWVDCAGDLKRFDPQRFPNGITKIGAALEQAGIAPGLWIDSGGLPHWTIGKNPAIRGCFTKGEGQGEICRACEPVNSLYKEAFIHHIRENKVRLLKFDNLGPSWRFPCCDNPTHTHLPGPLYSLEAIHNGVIDFLQALDRECPHVFIMLYWGYRSPWWLLHADTYFDSGIGVVEAASPADLPTPCARDSVTQKLDQAQWHSSDLPALGKDSLGIWLSDWPWNSQIGKERWQEGFVMDLCRGSMLAQVWADYDWLSVPEWRQLAEFTALLRAQPKCFGNPRFILGNPWQNEPYGYCCTDGRRAFLALNNCTWKDSTLPLTLNSIWGLPDNESWDLYRWYPDPVRMQGKEAVFGETVSIALRPFEVVLFEVVPHGQSPSLDRSFESSPVPISFPDASCPIELRVTENEPSRETESAANGEPAQARKLLVEGQVPRSRLAGMVVVSVEMKKDSAPMHAKRPGKLLSADGQLAGRGITCRPVLGTDTYPSCWQAWRIAVEPSEVARPLVLGISNSLPNQTELVFSGHFLPKDACRKGDKP